MMRGDKKWPPEHTRQQMQEEEEEQKKIAQGPVFKPKKAEKVGDNKILFVMICGGSGASLLGIV